MKALKASPQNTEQLCQITHLSHPLLLYITTHPPPRTSPIRQEAGGLFLLKFKIQKGYLNLNSKYV